MILNFLLGRRARLPGRRMLCGIKLKKKYQNKNTTNLNLFLIHNQFVQFILDENIKPIDVNSEIYTHVRKHILRNIVPRF